MAGWWNEINFKVPSNPILGFYDLSEITTTGMVPCLILTLIFVMVSPARIPNFPSGWNESAVILENWSRKGTGEPEGSCTHWAFKLTWEQSWTSWCSLTLHSWSKSHEYIFHSASWRSNLLWLFEYDQITSGSQVLHSFSLNFNLDKAQ